MTADIYTSLDARVTSLEKAHVRQERFFELMDKVDKRLEILEKHDEEFMLMVHQSCTLKDKDIQTSREEAIRISTDHANNNHRQTWAVIAFMASVIIGITVYFNAQNTSRAIDIQRNDTQIDSIKHTLDKIDIKIDKLSEHMASSRHE